MTNQTVRSGAVRDCECCQTCIPRVWPGPAQFLNMAAPGRVSEQRPRSSRKRRGRRWWGEGVEVCGGGKGGRGQTGSSVWTAQRVRTATGGKSVCCETPALFTALLATYKCPFFLMMCWCDRMFCCPAYIFFWRCWMEVTLCVWTIGTISLTAWQRCVMSNLLEAPLTLKSHSFSQFNTQLYPVS